MKPRALNGDIGVESLIVLWGSVSFQGFLHEIFLKSLFSSSGLSSMNWIKIVKIVKIVKILTNVPTYDEETVIMRDYKKL